MPKTRYNHQIEHQLAYSTKRGIKLETPHHHLSTTSWRLDTHQLQSENSQLQTIRSPPEWGPKPTFDSGISQIDFCSTKITKASEGLHKEIIFGFSFFALILYFLITHGVLKHITECVCIFLHPSSVYSYHMVCYRWAWVFDPNFPPLFLLQGYSSINLLLPKKQHSLKHNPSTYLHIVATYSILVFNFVCMFLFVCLFGLIFCTSEALMNLWNIILNYWCEAGETGRRTRRGNGQCDQREEGFTHNRVDREVKAAISWARLLCLF